MVFPKAVRSPHPLSRPGPAPHKQKLCLRLRLVSTGVRRARREGLNHQAAGAQAEHGVRSEEASGVSLGRGPQAERQNALRTRRHGRPGTA